jgi:hypothetical protein
MRTIRNKIRNFCSSTISITDKDLWSSNRRTTILATNFLFIGYLTVVMVRGFISI